MGCNWSGNFSESVTIRLSDGGLFRMTYAALVDHVVMLRLVIQRPDVTCNGKILQSAIDDYCRRMSSEHMHKPAYQRTLPVEIEWIWHVHRLHPHKYYDDCIRGSHDQKLVQKKVTRTSPSDYPQYTEQNVGNQTGAWPVPTFKPSIDLSEAVLRQKDFLESFRNHRIYLMDLRNVTECKFSDMVQYYALFLKLAKTGGKMLVPTYDIDIIWHTHMRFPQEYRDETVKIAGYILDHDDSVGKSVLENNYQETAKQWKLAYKSNYGEALDQKHLRSQSHHNCAVVRQTFSERHFSYNIHDYARSVGGHHSGGGGGGGGGDSYCRSGGCRNCGSNCGGGGGGGSTCGGSSCHSD